MDIFDRGGSSAERGELGRYRAQGRQKTWLIIQELSYLYLGGLGLKKLARQGPNEAGAPMDISD